MTDWQPISTAPTEDGVLHVRGVWVYSHLTGKPLYFDVCAEGEHEICEPVSAKEVSNYISEIERLQAKLAKAVDVIDWALIAWDDHNKHGYNMQGDWVSDARAIVAELTGGKDE